MNRTQLVKSGGVALALALTTLTGGCKVATSTGVTTPGAATTGGDTSAAGEEAGCANPDNHCLEAGEVLVADSAFESGYISAQVGVETAPANASGEVTFRLLADGGSKTSRHAFVTHRAAPDEIVVGALVAALDTTDGNIYRAPRTRVEATSNNWFLARIVSVDPAPQGHVIVSGGYHVSTDALRRVDGDTSATLTAPGAEDRWFVKPEHWFVSDAELPASGYISAHVALAIEPPTAKTKGDGRFLVTATGQDRWTRHAWRTRPATTADLKAGAHVVAFDATQDSVYRAPTSRQETLSGNWFIAKITDTSESYKGVVTLSGDYRTQVEGLRVLVP